MMILLIRCCVEIKGCAGGGYDIEHGILEEADIEKRDAG